MLTKFAQKTEWRALWKNKHQNGSHIYPYPKIQSIPLHLLISKKSSLRWVKLRMSIKTIQLICNALRITSFCKIRVSAETYFRINCLLLSQENLSLTYHTYQAGNYMFKVNSKNPSIKPRICSKLTRKTLERH